MNCKPNDLCVVVSVGGEPDLHFMLGQIRQVKKVEQAWDGPAWSYKGKRFVSRGLVCMAIPDAWLRPLRGDGITKKEVRDLYLPKPIETEDEVPSKEAA